MSTVNLPTPINTSLPILTTLFAIKSLWPKLYSGAVGCLPSSLDSKADERKYVSNVLKANGYTKAFLRNCQKPVTTNNSLHEREQVTGFAVIPYIQQSVQGVQGTHQENFE